MVSFLPALIWILLQAPNASASLNTRQDIAPALNALARQLKEICADAVEPDDLEELFKGNSASEDCQRLIAQIARILNDTPTSEPPRIYCSNIGETQITSGVSIRSHSHSIVCEGFANSLRPRDGPN